MCTRVSVEEFGMKFVLSADTFLYKQIMAARITQTNEVD